MTAPLAAIQMEMLKLREEGQNLRGRYPHGSDMWLLAQSIVTLSGAVSALCEREQKNFREAELLRDHGSRADYQHWVNLLNLAARLANSDKPQEGV